MIPRRTFLRGLATILAAPAIVRVSAIMPVRAVEAEPLLQIVGANDYPLTWSVWVKKAGEDWTRLSGTWGKTIEIPARCQIGGIALTSVAPDCKVDISPRPSPPSVV